MTDRLPCHQVLYISQLSKGQGYNTFASICHQSRPRNAGLAVNGALLFDGRRFCQLLQGPRQAVEALLGRIAGDARHEQLAILFSGPCGAEQAERTWTFGVCHDTGMDVFGLPESESAEPAVSAFKDLLARALSWP